MISFALLSAFQWMRHAYQRHCGTTAGESMAKDRAVTLEVPLYKLKLLFLLRFRCQPLSRDYRGCGIYKSAMAVTQHLARLLEIALHFACEGREGLSIGAIFVLGDRRHCLPPAPVDSQSLTGTRAGGASIHNPDFLETLRELAAMDGAFVVNRRGRGLGGNVSGCSVGGELRPGLGAPRRCAGHHYRDRCDGCRGSLPRPGPISVYDGGETALELARSPSGR